MKHVYVVVAVGLDATRRRDMKLSKVVFHKLKWAESRLTKDQEGKRKGGVGGKQYQSRSEYLRWSRNEDGLSEI